MAVEQQPTSDLSVTAFLVAVGGDARLDAEPDDDLVSLARSIEDGVRVSSARGVEVVRRRVRSQVLAQLLRS